MLSAVGNRRLDRQDKVVRLGDRWCRWSNNGPMRSDTYSSSIVCRWLAGKEQGSTRPWPGRKTTKVRRLVVEVGAQLSVLLCCHQKRVSRFLSLEVLAPSSQWHALCSDDRKEGGPLLNKTQWPRPTGLSAQTFQCRSTPEVSRRCEQAKIQCSGVGGWSKNLSMCNQSVWLGLILTVATAGSSRRYL